MKPTPSPRRVGHTTRPRTTNPSFLSSRSRLFLVCDRVHKADTTSLQCGIYNLAQDYRSQLPMWQDDIGRISRRHLHAVRVKGFKVLDSKYVIQFLLSKGNPDSS
ncbi:hypothetical protein NDU88_002290 [Pleurodeles waltl]|uniref:Uncharacterized protein n=1 Tax=Pleurodeles waltl TaxID=8319 RepID=A0AAV7UCR2_PLEWA|nr:hypothetical protein NDU88_002290 [Pleurodeles waltl]